MIAERSSSSVEIERKQNSPRVKSDQTSASEIDTKLENKVEEYIDVSDIFMNPEKGRKHPLIFHFLFLFLQAQAIHRLSYSIVGSQPS